MLARSLTARIAGPCCRTIRGGSSAAPVASSSCAGACASPGDGRRYRSPMPLLSTILIAVGLTGTVVNLGWAVHPKRRRGGTKLYSVRWWLIVVAAGCFAGAGSAGVLALF
ncbi:MAG: hypothetical protein K0S70_1440 [Microbacterium sp.]|jgi:hypothetical protein|nr:hypothetical protein [Microbacterium sp.]